VYIYTTGNQELITLHLGHLVDHEPEYTFERRDTTHVDASQRPSKENTIILTYYRNSKRA
jgi:hypothetical protein